MLISDGVHTSVSDHWGSKDCQRLRRLLTARAGMIVVLKGRVSFAFRHMRETGRRTHHQRTERLLQEMLSKTVRHEKGETQSHLICHCSAKTPYTYLGRIRRCRHRLHLPTVPLRGTRRLHPPYSNLPKVSKPGALRNLYHVPVPLWLRRLWSPFEVSLRPSSDLVNPSVGRLCTRRRCCSSLGGKAHQGRRQERWRRQGERSGGHG